MKIAQNLGVFLFLTLGLSSCIVVTAAVGGAGYFVGSDKRTVGTIIDDGVITSRINVAFMKDDKISAIDVNVDTSNGVVILRGDVIDEAEAKYIMSLVESVKGVEQIISKLKITKY